ncbi:MAG: sulfite exporter TauE/SafE family protein [Chthoniobacterales bacterium]
MIGLLAMHFPISGTDISPVYLVIIGFLIGVMGGFFGVGGSFIAGPALRAVGMHWNYAVGTDLAHIVGKSVVAAKRHRALGNVDLRLGFIMALGTIAGAECGAQLIQLLKRQGNVDFVVSVISIAIYCSISSFMVWESWKTMRLRKKNTGGTKSAAKGKKKSAEPDISSFDHVTKAIQRFPLWPMVSLPTSGIKSISLWVIILVSFIGGLFSGFLGGGAGYIRMPMMVYVLGIPTHLAVGTDLFEIIISASYGTFSHAVKGNVDILVALVMNTGAAIGAQIGAILTQYFAGPKIRLLFVPLPLIGAAIVLYTLFTGHKL